jgi:DNA-binding NarL/FixJ family response regulator
LSVHQTNDLALDHRRPPIDSQIMEGGKLTPTQYRVLLGVHSGLANKQIAFDLGIAEATVKAHMTALMRKLNVRNRTQVALLAEKLDVLELS